MAGKHPDRKGNTDRLSKVEEKGERQSKIMGREKVMSQQGKYQAYGIQRSVISDEDAPLGGQRRVK